MMLCNRPNLQSTGSSDSHNVPYDEQLQQPLQISKSQRQAAARVAAAKSKNKLWGPSHSFDSDDSDNDNDDDDLNLNPNNNNQYASNLGVQGGFGCGGGMDGVGAAGGSFWQNMGKVWTELNASAVMQAVVRPSMASTAKTGSSNRRRNGRKGNSNNNNNSNTNSKPMEVVQEEDGCEESDTDPSTQDNSAEAAAAAEADDKEVGGARVVKDDSSPESLARQEVSTSRDINSIRTAGGGMSSTPPPTQNNNPANATTTIPSKVEEWTDMIFNANACVGSPCSAQDLEDIFGQQQQQQQQQGAQQKNNINSNCQKVGNACGLGIAPMAFDFGDEDDDNVVATAPRKKPLQQRQQQATKKATATTTTAPPAPQRTFSEDSTPAERRRLRNQVRRQRHEHAASSVTAMLPHEDFEVTSQQDVLVTQPTTTALLQQQSSHLPPPPAEENQQQKFAPQQPQQQQQQPQPPLPIETLLVREAEAVALERSISELTMRSSYQPPATTSTADAPPEQRRMAYYAVGRHHRLTAGGSPNGPNRTGGNRRCYFTGKLIFGGAPFYAGIVQQGLRTLVVFCLPSALGMPQNLPGFAPPTGKHQRSSSGGLGGGLLQRSRRTLSSAASISTRKSLLSVGSRSKAHSKLSSTIHFDDMSLSLDGDIDPNWNMDNDYLLRVLPEPTDGFVLTEMNSRFPEQFETLPVQVRHPKCWRIYVKFCFFSGLPIAEGELHYQVHPALALELYGEDIVLSHDVLEAVNGVNSADILKLPNQKTFRYLKKHYQQQSAKLPEVVFKRTSWEQVKSEV